MSLVTNAIQHLLGGVSKQPAEMRYPFQAEEHYNWFPRAATGLSRRPPAEWVCDLAASIGATNFIKIVRLGTTDYLLTVTPSGTITIRSLAGVAQSVTDSGGVAAPYLTTTTPKDELEALVIADTILLLNKTKTVTYTSTASIADHVYATGVGLNGIAGFTIAVGDANMDYKVTVTDLDGSGNDLNKITISYTSGASNASIDDIIAGLVTNLNASGWAGMRAKKAVAAGNSVILLDTSGSHFRVSMTGSSDATGTAAINRDVACDKDKLPTLWYPGFYVKAKVGSSNNQKTEVWFRSKLAKEGAAEEALTTIVTGTYATPNTPVAVVWYETNSPHASGNLTTSTMPIKLYLSSGNWTVGYGDWASRKAGDTLTNKTPSVVGKTIKSLVVFRNRLGLVCADSLVMSQAGTFYNLFRTSIATTLDEDRIDCAIAYKDYVNIQHALVLNENLLLIGAKAQFVIRGANTFTPETASAALTSNYDVNLACPPVSVGRRVTFTTVSGSSLLVRGLIASVDRDNYLIDEFGAHIPGYIPSDVTRLVHADAYGLSYLYKPNSAIIYVNNWVYDERNGQARQNAFHKWDFNTNFLYADLVDNYVYLVGTTFVQRIDLRQDAADSLGYLIHLDKRTQVVSGSYSSVYDQTTLTTPYTMGAGLKVVDTVTGEEVTIVSSVGTTLIVEGDHTNVFIGYLRDSTYDFSKFVVQRKDAAGTVTPLFGGRLQMRSVSVLFKGLGYLKGILTLPGRDASVTAAYVQSGSIADETLIGEASVTTGTIKVPILGNADQAQVQLVNDSFLPCTLLSAEWTGYWHERSKRI